jgi:hypothetical protein
MGKRIEPAHPVTIGSYWQDAFLPGYGRIIKVMDVDETHATVMTLVNDHNIQRNLDLPYEVTGVGYPRDMRGTVRRVRRDRFRPTNKGFVPVADGPAEVARRDQELAEWRESIPARIAAENRRHAEWLASDPLNGESLGLDEASVEFGDLPAEETIFL